MEENTKEKSVEEARKFLEITPEEIESLKTYQGYGHWMINILADMSPDRYENINRSLVENDKQVEKWIDNFVNIYSAMYKNSLDGEPWGDLIRGTRVGERIK